MVEFYNTCRSLAEELKRHGVGGANGMLEVIDTGSTGTEILMGLGHYLEKILVSENLPSELRQGCRELTTRIDPNLRD
jgi:hypothetical protein